MPLYVYIAVAAFVGAVSLWPCAAVLIVYLRREPQTSYDHGIKADRP